MSIRFSQCFFFVIIVGFLVLLLESSGRFAESGAAGSSTLSSVQDVEKQGVEGAVTAAGVLRPTYW